MAPIHRTNTKAMIRMIRRPLKTPICRDRKSAHPGNQEDAPGDAMQDLGGEIL
jgi:hypothetical protein